MTRGPRTWLAIAAGGVVGAWVRWLVFVVFDDLGWWRIGDQFGMQPATLAVNIAGCGALGFASRALQRERLRFAVTVGFCGALTTMSTLAVDVVEILRLNADSETWALAHLGLAVVGGVIAFVIGRQLGRRPVEGVAETVVGA